MSSFKSSENIQKKEGGPKSTVRYLFRFKRIFETFKNKIHADYMSSVNIDITSFISKCSTHISGAKCDLKLDAHFKSVGLSGIGFKK